MAAGDVARIIRAPGRLVVGPTDLAAAYPHGGTEVGLTNAVVLQPTGSGFLVRNEALGESTDVLEGGNEFAFACFLRGFDDDAVAQFFPDRHSTGSVSGHSVFSVPGTNAPGASALGRAVIVLYVPDDALHVPAILVYRGIPDFPDGAEMAFQRRDELGLPVSMHCVRDANDNTLAVGRLADLSLS